MDAIESKALLSYAGAQIPNISLASFLSPDHVVESAWLEHAPFAFWLMEAVRPLSLVELGTHNGFSFLTFCQAIRYFSLSTACYAVDTWLGDEHAGFYGEEVYQRLAALNDRHYAGFARLLRCRFDEALPYFPEGSIDLLHIDGRHKYEDVRHDYSIWRTRLSSRGLILFHDTNVRERDFGVWRLWAELSKEHPSFEFMHGHGLGVLAVGPDIPQSLKGLLSAGPDQAGIIRAAYARLGHAVSQRYQLDVAHRHLGEAAAEQHRLRDAQAAQAAAQALQDDRERMLAEQARLAVTLHTLQNRAAAERSRAAALEGESAKLLQQIGEQNTSIQVLRNSLENHEHVAEELRAVVERLEFQADASHQQLLQLQQSTFWRITGPLRAILARLPPSLRLTLRRSSKALYWAVTPHRIGQRLAFLQSRQSATRALPASSAPAPAPSPPRHIAFHPLPPGQGGDRTAGRNGHYMLQDRPAGYVYVPPRRPAKLDRILAGLSSRPRFSVIVPTYDTPTDLLSRMFASVQAQWYPNWQLILADDASPRAETRRFLDRIDDPRVEVLLLEKNCGISGATNAALERATGDYVVFLDHDDELTEDCLYELALCISRDDPDYIYSDEDKIDEQGRFTQPFFKPDWSPDTIMSTMYTCHVSCIRRSLLQEVGPLRSEYDGSQDWDLALRVAERAQRVSHVPKVLYHWRIIPTSVAADLSAKPYAIEAARKLREEALQRRGRIGTLEEVEQVPGYHRVRYAVHGTPLISIIIPSRNNGSLLRPCIDSLNKTSAWQNFEIVVLDNGSDQPETLDILSRLAEREAVRIIRHAAPFNYSELNNIGVREARGELLLFLNDDTELLSPDGLERMAGYAQLPHIGAVGAKLLYPKTLQVQHAGVINLAYGPSHAFLYLNADSPGYFMRNLLEYNWSAVTGACLMIERPKFEAVQGFDENFPIGYNDVDLCFRLLRQGLYNLVCPSVRLLHHESFSRGMDRETPEGQARLDAERHRLYAAHPEFLMWDPFFSQNLHPDNLHFEIP